MRFQGLSRRQERPCRRGDGRLGDRDARGGGASERIGPSR